MAFKKEIISRRRADLEPDCEIMVCDMQVCNIKKNSYCTILQAAVFQLRTVLFCYK